MDYDLDVFGLIDKFDTLMKIIIGVLLITLGISFFISAPDACYVGISFEQFKAGIGLILIVIGIILCISPWRKKYENEKKRSK